MAADGKYLYFASDLHLGAPNALQSIQREKAFIAWLNYIQPTAKAIYLLGDVFDFWFEYKTVVPKGYTRLFGKLAELSDTGIEIHFFKGNHDMWVLDYFEKELGLQIHSNELTFEWANKRFYLHHGDGLGPGDYKYKFLKQIFRSPICQWLFARLHPNFGIQAFCQKEVGLTVAQKISFTTGHNKNGYMLMFKKLSQNSTTISTYLGIATSLYLYPTKTRCMSILAIG